MLAIIKIYNWNSIRIMDIDENIRVGTCYVIENNHGRFICEVGNFCKNKDQEKDKSGLCISEEINSKQKNGELFKIIRKADQKDLEKAEKNKKEETEILSACKEKIKEMKLPMKLVGANCSLDSSSVIIAFTAENRVDFRELVRSLMYNFKKTVRLEQIGSRDEARIKGGFGPCGRELCCFKFNGILKSINTEMAKIQQITHRGSERISGCCGRLKCCLAYELENYEESIKGLPPIGTEVKTKNGRGNVKELKTLQKKALIDFGNKDSRWYEVEDLIF